MDGTVFGPQAVAQIRQMFRDFYAETDPSSQLGYPQFGESRKLMAIAYTNAAGSLDQFVSVSLYKRDPVSNAETDTGVDVNALCGYGAVNANTRVLLRRDVWGWEIIQARCGN
jgi:hypothetical protein